MGTWTQWYARSAGQTHRTGSVRGVILNAATRMPCSLKQRPQREKAEQSVSRATLTVNYSSTAQPEATGIVSKTASDPKCKILLHCAKSAANRLANSGFSKCLLGAGGGGVFGLGEIWNGEIWCGGNLAQILKSHGEIWYKIFRLWPGGNYDTGN